MWYDYDMTYLIEKRIVLGTCYEDYPKNFSVIHSKFKPQSGTAGRCCGLLGSRTYLEVRSLECVL